MIPPGRRRDDEASSAGGVDEGRLRLLYDLGIAFAERTDLEELIPLVIAKCRQVLRAHGAAILLLDAQTDELYFPYVAQERPAVAAELLRTRFPAHLGHAGAVLQSGKASRVDDASAAPQFYAQIDRKTNSRTGPMLTAPLFARQGRIGVIQVVNQRGASPFSDEDLSFLETLAASVAVAIENARLYAEMRASQEDLKEQVAALRDDLAGQDPFANVLGSSKAMAEVVRMMARAAASSITVLVQGETGTGKELVARGIHAASARARQPFVAINCGALTETLLESELFGHRRGSFTGALQSRRGLFEAAAGGTILLDEVGEMPPEMQVKLLRVLQDGEIIPVGETSARKVDVRVISATNRDLTKEVERGTFRTDLYYRLTVFPIQLPPLRDHREDVSAMATHILATISSRLGRPPIGIDPGALDLLVRFDWPGNVRELQNEIERAVALLGTGSRIRKEHLSAKILAGANLPVPRPGKGSLRGSGRGATGDPDVVADKDLAAIEPLRSARARFEREYIEQVLQAHGGNVSHSATALGLSRAMLHKRLRAAKEGR